MKKAIVANSSERVELAPVEVKVKVEATVEVRNVEADVEAETKSGERIPVVEGRVSLCSALSARCSREVDILSFLCSDSHKEVVMKIRATTNPDRRRELKKRLPAITPAGVFTPRRGAGFMRSYSGMLGVDIDGEDNPHVEDWSSVAHRIGHLWSSVVYAGLSVGGCGCFVLYRIAEPWRYAEHYADIVTSIEALGFKVDTACRDLTRLRFASYDPTPYLNREATMHLLPAERCTPPRNTPKEPISRPQPSTTEQRPHQLNRASRGEDLAHLYPRIEQAVATIAERTINIAESYDIWYRIGCALASAYGEQGRWLYHAISAQSTKYRQGECDVQYNRCMRCGGIGIGTLLRHFKDAGVRW